MRNTSNITAARLYDQLDYAAALVRQMRGFKNKSARALSLGYAIEHLRVALGLANRAARHLRGSIMRALNFARAALRACA